jgi:ZIP family zinc transporter
MDDSLVNAIIFSSIAGLMVPVGIIAAQHEHIGSDWLQTELRHGVIAFGGGVLVSAVALVLVPVGVAVLEPWSVILSFVAGGAAFAVLDAWLVKSGRRLSQMVAMLADFIPESIALGALFASGSEQASLLAVLIGLQNLPEAFNTYREMAQSGPVRSRRIIVISFILALAGPLFAVIGVLFLSHSPESVGVIMLFAAGGILYLIFQDIAPQAQLQNRWGPPAGAIAGFAFGLAGAMLV